jgi:hypothetical protein
MGAAATGTWARPFAAVAPENGVVVSFEDGEGGIQHFPARHDDNVEAGGDLMAPEHLSGEAFGAVAFDSWPELPRSRNAEPRRGAAVRHHEQGHEPAVDASAFTVNTLEFWPAADALGNRQSLPVHAMGNLRLVSDREPLTALCAASLEDDSAVLGRHSDSEAVRLFAPAFVRLVGALSLHVVLFE